MNELFDVSGKVIVVTGATGILAGGAAQYLQKNGAKVVYLGRNQERVDKAITEAEAISPDCMGVTCDVLDEQGLEAGYSKVVDKFGRVDALINGAGGNMPGATIGPDKEIFDLDLKDYSKVMDLNLKGTVVPTLVFGKAFKDQGTGCVINFSSMSSTQALTRVLGYSNAKAAIDNLLLLLLLRLLLLLHCEREPEHWPLEAALRTRQPLQPEELPQFGEAACVERAMR